MNQRIILRKCSSLEHAEVLALQIEEQVKNRWREDRWSDSKVKIECRGDESEGEITLVGDFGGVIDITGLIKLSN